MPILRRRTNSATTQRAGQAAVPSQRDTQEGTTSAQTAAQDSRGEASGATGTGAPAAQAEGRQAVATETRAEPRPESRPAAGHDDFYVGAILTIVSGLVSIFMGLTGIISGSFYNNVANFPFYYSVRSRGITLLVIGAIAFLVGLALVARMHWARTGAIVIAVLGALANFMFLPYYPFWSVVVVALNVVIIWELARHRDSREYARLQAGVTG
jgi:hypothetical protein